MNAYKKIKFIPTFQTGDGTIVGQIVTDDIFQNLVCNAEEGSSKQLVKAYNMHAEAMDTILELVRESKSNTDAVKKAIELLNRSKE